MPIYIRTRIRHNNVGPHKLLIRDALVCERILHVRLPAAEHREAGTGIPFSDTMFKICPGCSDGQSRCFTHSGGAGLPVNASRIPTGHGSHSSQPFDTSYTSTPASRRTSATRSLVSGSGPKPGLDHKLQATTRSNMNFVPIYRHTLIWNDFCQTVFFRFCLHVFWEARGQAASTMHQSDIRGLVRVARTSADSELLRRERGLLRVVNTGPKSLLT